VIKVKGKIAFVAKVEEKIATPDWALRSDKNVVGLANNTVIEIIY